MGERIINSLTGVILVGHGGIPKDYPRELVTKLKTLEGMRQRLGGEPSQEEEELDMRIRHWPRTPQSDPYKIGLETLADHIRPFLNGARFVIAYNEFCAPTLEEAAENLMKEGQKAIVVIPSMFTPGGVHSEIEIPKVLDTLRTRHPSTNFHYIWPFDLNLVARMLSEQLKRM